MKPIRLLALSLVTAVTASAQTNTFPLSGNVGIGTTDPQSAVKLDVRQPGVDSMAVAGYAYDGTGSQATGVYGVGYSSSGNGTTYGVQGLSTGSRTGGINVGGHFSAQGAANNYALITGTGNVGIGTATPDAPLSVNGRIRSNSWHPYGSDSNDLYVDVEPNTRILRTRNWNESSPNIAATGIHTGTGYFDGNVGIGTTSPAAKLDVLGEIWSTEALRCTRPALGLNNALGTDGSGGLVGTLSNHHLALWTNGANRVQITTTGNVGIGETNPTHKLAVNGTIKAKEVIVETSGWSDYVFTDNYALQPLAEVEAHIKINRHLPGIPSASEVATQGVSLGDMQAKLLAKIEELTLHQIAQEKLLKAQAIELKAQLAGQAEELTSLRAEVRASRK